MRRAAFLLASFLIAASARATTVEEILQKYTEARGGLDKLRAIHSLPIDCWLTPVDWLSPSRSSKGNCERVLRPRRKLSDRFETIRINQPPNASGF